MAQRESTPQHWQSYWDGLQDYESYANDDRIVGRLLPELPASPLVLEVGAGTGRDSVALAQRGAQMIVVDYIPRSLDIVREAARRNGVEIPVVCADARQMPFRDGTFDGVFHAGLLEHFRAPQDQRLLDENARVLRPGGVLLVDVPQTYHLYTLAKQTLIALGRWFAGWETQYSPAQLEAMVRASGLTVRFTYGEWMVPGLWYRTLRLGLAKLRLARLPQVPWHVNAWEAAIAPLKRGFRGTRLHLYTCAVIGTVGKKP